MDNKNKPDGFSYTYSAKEQAEIKKIREKYALSEQAEDKMEQLRRLDSGVTKKGTVVSLIIGILGSLIMGVGMSIAMTEIGELLGKFSMLVRRKKDTLSRCSRSSKSFSRGAVVKRKTSSNR